MPKIEGIGEVLPMSELNGEEALGEDEDLEGNGQAMNGQYLENGVYVENGVEDGANDDHADSHSEDTEDTNGGDTEDTNGGDTEDTNGDTNGDTFDAMNGMSQELNDEPMENDDEPEVYANGIDNGEPEVFRNGRDNGFNEENGQNGLIIG